MKLVRLGAGASLPAGNLNCQQARYVLDGAINWNGEKFPALSMMYYPSGVVYPETESASEGTTLLVVQWTGAGQEFVPFSVL